MARVIRRLKDRFWAGRQLNLFFWLLAVTTTAALASWLVDLVGTIHRAGSLQEAWSSGWSAGDFLVPLFRSKLFQALALVLGWSFWFGGKRRHLDQIRLRRAEQRYRDIINHAGEAMFLLDAVGRVMEWNKAAEALFASPRRAVLGRPFRDIHLCYGVKIDEAIADAKRLGRSLQFEFPFPRPGRPGGLVSLTISPISEGLGHAEQAAKAFVVIARDITSEKQLETKMSETEKLAGIGQLAAGIAHQLNTPLGSILLSAQMLEGTIKQEDQEEDVRRIIRQTEQCRRIIKGLLNLARPTGKERGQLHLGELLRETVYLIEKNIKLAGAEVVIQEQCEPIIYGNRNEIDQVFFNLLSNALDAMPEGGEISIILRDGEPGEVLVEFGDSGEGIPRENHNQVFLPFYTTKEYGKGTGLGLSIVARIVHEHGGRIEMESDSGKGTKFFLSFPRPGFGLQRGAEQGNTG